VRDFDSAIERLQVKLARQDHEAEVALASLVRVEGYRRRGLKGQSEKVNAYIRKQLDAAGFGSAKTKKGAFTSDTKVSDERANARIVGSAGERLRAEREYADRLAATIEANDQLRKNQDEIKKTPEWKQRSKGLRVEDHSDDGYDQRDLMTDMMTAAIKAGTYKRKEQYEADILKRKGLSTESFGEFRFKHFR
jgi:hypothetical protein